MLGFKQLYESKKVSAGVIVKSGGQMLGCMVLGSRGRYFDLPKGEIDPGESAIDAAVRELWEETNLRVSKGKLKNLGRHPYLTGKYAKDIHLFLYEPEVLPQINTMKCNSFFDDPKTGKRRPEVIGFQYLPIEELSTHMIPKMAAVIKKVLK